MHIEDFFAMFIGFGLVVGIPITAILTHHQRKMAELIHGKMGDQNTNQALLHEIQSLRYEVSQLRESVNQQRIDMDDLKSLTIRPILTPDQDILGQGR